MFDGEGHHTLGFPELVASGNWDLRGYAHGLVGSVECEAFKLRHVPHLPCVHPFAPELTPKKLLRIC